MSLIKPYEQSTYSLDQKTERCFYCGADVTNKQFSIYWAGTQDNVIYMHAECARSLSIRLLRDVHEWECSPGNDPSLCRG